MSENTGAAALDKLFEETYGAQPTHAVWSPGRVNLIGEHTDYNLLPVLPMAIGRGFSMRLRPAETGMVRVKSIDASFPMVEFQASGDLPKYPTGHWGNYIKAAVNQVYPRILKDRGKVAGFDAVIDSNLPPAAGLSSSSALVVASYRAFAAANDWDMPAVEAGEQMRLAEWYVGTASGGMDQAVICLGREGRALKIDFAPLRTEEVPLPQEVTFFAINSMEHAAKSGNVRLQYNRRTVECNAGMMLMARTAGADGEGWTSLRDAYEYFAKTGKLYSEAALEAVGTEPWSIAQLQKALGTRFDELLKAKQMPPCGDAFWNDFPPFQLYGRVMHVLEETDRLYDCMKALRKGDWREAALLVSESHYSCRDLYHISTPGLERLVSSARRAGAAAARITGAGFGGSVVAVVERQLAASFTEKIWELYFVPLLKKTGAEAPEPSSVIIDCEPVSGARAWKL